MLKQKKLGVYAGKEQSVMSDQFFFGVIVRIVGTFLLLLGLASKEYKKEKEPQVSDAHFVERPETCSQALVKQKLLLPMNRKTKVTKRQNMKRKIFVCCLLLVLAGCSRKKEWRPLKLPEDYFILTTRQGDKMTLTHLKYHAGASLSLKEVFVLRTSISTIDVPNDFTHFRRFECLDAKIPYPRVRIDFGLDGVIEGVVESAHVLHQYFTGGSPYGEVTIRFADVQSIERQVKYEQ